MVYETFLKTIQSMVQTRLNKKSQRLPAAGSEK